MTKQKASLLSLFFFLSLFSSLGAQTPSWLLGGNNNVGTNQYLGTSTPTDLEFRTNGQPQILINDTQDQVEIINDLEVQGTSTQNDIHIQANRSIINQGDPTRGSILFSTNQMILRPGSVPLRVDGNFLFNGASIMFNQAGEAVSQYSNTTLDGFGEEPLRMYKPLTLEHQRISGNQGGPHILSRDNIEMSFGTIDNSNSFQYAITHGIAPGQTEPIVTFREDLTAEYTGMIFFPDNGRAAGDPMIQIGNDVTLSDMDFANTLGIYGVQDPTRGAIRLGSNGSTIHGVLGNIGIGTINPQFELDVVGVIRACEVRVNNDSQWCDYVFAEDYELMDLKDLKSFIEENKHLPNIPPASEVESQGQNLGDMQIHMMEKIEELTLYILQLQEQNETLSLEIQQIKDDQDVKTIND